MNEPIISPETNLPEITLKAVMLSVILTVVLVAANAYLALKVGITISASIPAAVIALGVLQFFKHNNILECNIVQTAASAGEGLAAAISFVLPALIIVHFWKGFGYWESTIIAMMGGILGVLFSIPLRRVLLNLKGLTFPEGQAIGNVLAAKAQGAAQLPFLVKGSLIGAGISLLQSGFKVVASSMSLWFAPGNSLLIGFGLGFEPALIAAGYIIGFGTAIAMLIGVVMGWVIGVPVITSIYGIPDAADTTSAAMDIWNNYVRYIGVGTMLIGGIWTLLNLFKPIITGLKFAFRAMQKRAEEFHLPRTDQDIPIQYVLIGVALISIFVFMFMLYISHKTTFFTDQSALHIMAFLGLVYILVGGFFSASICGYFTGLVGSTNNPLSGIVLATVLLVSLLLSFFIGDAAIQHSHELRMSAVAFVIIIATVVACVSCIANENIQDLKAGQMIGATPWRQQVMLVIGVVVSALTIAPILELLFQAYGLGGVLPHPNMDPTQTLGAPQAGLMAAVAQGVFGHSLPWPMIITGIVIALFVIIFDRILQKRGIRLPVLAVGLGIYLPVVSTAALVIGGIVSHLVHRKPTDPYRTQGALLLACGLVAGASLMGVILAVPFALQGSANALSLVDGHYKSIIDIVGLVVTGGLCYWIYTVATKERG